MIVWLPVGIPVVPGIQNLFKVQHHSRLGTGGQVTQAKVGFPPEGLEGWFFQSGGIWRDYFRILCLQLYSSTQF